MKIRDLQFSNFKSFGNYQSPVTSRVDDLRKMNMVFGDNNSGKSNLLKFLDLIFQRKISRQSVFLEEGGESRTREEIGSFWKGSIVDQPFIYHKNNRQFPIVFTITLEVTDNDLQVSGFIEMQKVLAAYPSTGNVSTLVLNGEIINDGSPSNSTIKLTSVDLNGANIFTDAVSGKTYFTGIDGLEGESQTFESLLDIFNDSVLFLDTDRSFTNENENITSPPLTSKTFKNWLHNLSRDTISYQKYENFIKFIRAQTNTVSSFKYFEPTFFKRGDEIDLVLSNGNERLPIANYGTGIHQILFLLGLLFETKAKIILIEELELNLSPKTQRELFQILRNLITSGEIHQIIFTTHSPYFNFVTDFQIYQVKLNKTGVSSITNESGNRQFFKGKKLH